MLLSMDSLKINRHGIQAKMHEKHNVMTPFNKVIFIIVPILLFCMLFTHDLWLKIFCAVLATIIIIVWLSIYTAHSIKSPKLLQSEAYRIEEHRIEAGMLTNKNEVVEQQEVLTTNITPLLETKDRKDIIE